MTLVIYDNKGQKISMINGNYVIPQGGVQYLEVEIPQAKILKSIDVTTTPHVPIFEDIPPLQTEILENQVADLTYQLMLKGVI